MTSLLRKYQSSYCRNPSSLPSQSFITNFATSDIIFLNFLIKTFDFKIIHKSTNPPLYELLSKKLVSK